MPKKKTVRKAPTKPCPKCKASVPAATKNCPTPDCGYVWKSATKKKKKRAGGTDGGLTGQLQAERERLQARLDAINTLLGD